MLCRLPVVPSAFTAITTNRMCCQCCLAGDAAAWTQEGLDDWIASNLEQPQLRRARVRALTKAAQPFGYERAKTVMTIGTALSDSVK